MPTPFVLTETEGVFPRFFGCGHVHCGARYRGLVYGRQTPWVTTTGKCPKCQATDVIRYVRVCPHCGNLIVAGVQVAIDCSDTVTEYIGEQGYEEVAGGVLVCAGCADIRGITGFGYWGANGYSDIETEGL